MYSQTPFSSYKYKWCKRRKKTFFYGFLLLLLLSTVPQLAVLQCLSLMCICTKSTLVNGIIQMLQGCDNSTETSEVMGSACNAPLLQSLITPNPLFLDGFFLFFKFIELTAPEHFFLSNSLSRWIKDVVHCKHGQGKRYTHSFACRYRCKDAQT